MKLIKYIKVCACAAMFIFSTIGMQVNAEVPVCDAITIKHIHTGNENSGGGCYQQNMSFECVIQNRYLSDDEGPGSNGTTGPACYICHNNMGVWIEYTETHLNCGLGAQPGMRGWSCRYCGTGMGMWNHDSTHSIVKYGRNCREGTQEYTYGTFSITAAPTEWVKDFVTLTPGFDNPGGLTVNQGMPYLWTESPGLTPEGNNRIVTENGSYSCTLNTNSTNCTQVSIPITISNIDKTAPKVEVEYDHTKFLTETWINVRAEDLQPDMTGGSGLAAEPYSWDGGGTWTSDAVKQITDNGTYLLQVQDGVGNISTCEIIIDFLDITPPRISCEPNTTEWTRENITLTCTAEDLQPDGQAGSGLAPNAYSWDGGITWGSNTTLEVTENGIYSVQVQDSLGNIASKEVTVSVIDRTPPIVTCSLNTYGWSQTEVTVYCIAQDLQPNGSKGVGLGVEAYSWDGGKTWSGISSFATGEMKLYQVLVRDVLGNQSSGEVLVDNLDNSPPKITISMEPQIWMFGSAVLTANASDDKSGLEKTGAYSWMGGIWSEKNTLEIKKEGTYSVRVRDLAGNIAYASIDAKRLDFESLENSNMPPEVKKPKQTKAKEKERTEKVTKEEELHKEKTEEAVTNTPRLSKEKQPDEVKNLYHWKRELLLLGILILSAVLWGLLVYLLLQRCKYMGMIYGYTFKGKKRYLGLVKCMVKESYYMVKIPGKLLEKAETNEYCIKWNQALYNGSTIKELIIVLESGQISAILEQWVEFKGI